METRRQARPPAPELQPEEAALGPFCETVRRGCSFEEGAPEEEEWLQGATGERRWEAAWTLCNNGTSSGGQRSVSLPKTEKGRKAE